MEDGGIFGSCWKEEPGSTSWNLEDFQKHLCHWVLMDGVKDRAGWGIPYNVPQFYSISIEFKSSPHSLLYRYSNRSFKHTIISINLIKDHSKALWSEIEKNVRSIFHCAQFNDFFHGFKTWALEIFHNVCSQNYILGT